jgi:hypothetical protein
MNPQLPFDPVALILSGVWHGAGLAVMMFTAAPIWVQVLLVAVFFIRFFRPDLLPEENPRRRSKRRRWRRDPWD